MAVELVLLHPLPLDGETWRALRSLTGPVMTHAPNLYELGSSLREVAGRVLELAEGNRLVVVGNSIGGSCALEMAAAAPDRIEHLVLVGAKAGHRPEPRYRDWALALVEQGGVTKLWDQVWGPLFSSTTAPSVVERARTTAQAIPPHQLANGIRMFHGRQDRSELIGNWAKPLTVVTGTDDPTPGLAMSQRLAEQAPNGSLHVVPDCGHYVPIERPDALAAIVNQAIRSPGNT